MVETLAFDVVGTGPRLHLLTEDSDANARLADAFEEWTAAVGLAETLRTYREARAVDGESFAALATNPELPTPVKLSLTLVEADQVATPSLFIDSAAAVDGIEFDRWGNPSVYHVLKDHPGDTMAMGSWGDYQRVPASLMLHWFKRRRPGQCRGVPELTPSLPLFALLRRYDLATVTAAEVAALFAALLKTNMPPGEDEEEGTTILPFDRQEITRGMMVALPEGYDAVQLRPEHPATTHEMFVKVTLRGVARCLHIPYAIAAGDLSDVNYSSGQLGYQNYQRAVGVDRYFLETHVLDRVLRAWIDEARLADPEAVDGIPPNRLPRHQWRWDRFRHYDPTKEAEAQAMRLANGTSSIQRECAEEGYDWREIADENAEARAYYAERGLPFPGDAAEGGSAASNANEPEEPPVSRPRAAAKLNGHRRLAYPLAGG